MKRLIIRILLKFILLVTQFSLCLSVRAEVIVYSNNFDNGTESLSDFVIGKTAGCIGPYSIGIESGQLTITTSTPLPSGGYAAISISHFEAPYNNILKNNPGLVSWSFNVSNSDGIFNNEFFFALASNSYDARVYTSTTYIFGGGGFVGNRMMLIKQGPGQFTPIIAIEDGLPTLPSKGSFRITYNPDTNVWNLYGKFGSSYVDPTSVTNLLGSCVDGTYTNLPLSYMCMIGGTTGNDYFDNVTVSVIPEPTTLLLIGLGGLILGRKR